MLGHVRTAALLILLALSGCSRGEGSATAATEDPAWKTYRRDLAPLADKERSALAAVAERTGAGYTDDAALLAALRDVALPRYREYVAGLDAVQPPKDAEQIHARMRELAARELAVLERIERALERRDGTAILAANREHRELRGEIDALLGDLRAARAKRTGHATGELPASASGKP
jgi:hypothetical protein